ncbi:hypothetical protein HPB47_004421 [Ixodes persulcatus]|uniref:Uncharacterized protein n=1 Tax=Ixodes persulcatus TaxID=34615 RepID=A0AC60PFS9_IXOPE|nr:hypothetical protein HPB47_004421 [Ixodes persulcatus]
MNTEKKIKWTCKICRTKGARSGEEAVDVNSEVRSLDDPGLLGAQFQLMNRKLDSLPSLKTQAFHIAAQDWVYYHVSSLDEFCNDNDYENEVCPAFGFGENDNIRHEYLSDQSSALGDYQLQKPAGIISAPGHGASVQADAEAGGRREKDRWTVRPLQDDDGGGAPNQTNFCGGGDGGVEKRVEAAFAQRSACGGGVALRLRRRRAAARGPTT